MLTINTNVNSLFSSRMLTANTNAGNKAMERLSSGLRINSAADDASGLAISDRMTSQIRGLNQAHRNISDGISLLQTAEGAMQEITELLQRGRELSVQAANAVVSNSDKQSIQAEVNQIKQEVTRISENTTFNGQFILKSESSSGSTNFSDKLDIETGLRSGWLRNSEQMITDAFGLTAPGTDLTVNYVDDSGNSYVAWVTSSYSGSSLEAVSQELNIDLSDFTPVTNADGGTAPYYNDRIIAHEMVHAVMGVTMNSQNLSTWFKEGAAEIIQGADERLAGALSNRIATDGNIIDAANNLVGTLNDGWGSGSGEHLNEQYATAYVAMRFLHEEIKTAGGTGIDELMGLLNANKADNSYELDEAFADIQSAHGTFAYADEADFLAAFTATNGAGSNYLQTMSTSGDLANSDTGAIGGLDADSGSIKTASSVVPNGASYEKDPLVGFNTIWSEKLTLESSVSSTLIFQVGANVNEQIEVNLSGVSAQSLNIDDMDVTQDANLAIIKIDQAISVIDENRGQLGAQMNRFEHALSVTMNAAENLTAARSRILDADIAFETAQLTKRDILKQAAVSMLSQASSSPQLALQLLS